MKIKKIMVVSFAMGAAFAISPAVAVSADACAANRVCLYDDNDFGSYLGSKAANTGLVNISAGKNDKTDSWKNRTNYKASWYHNPNGGSTCRTMNANSTDNNISFLDSDRLSSWRTDHGC